MLEKIEAYAKEVGKDVETVWQEFVDFIEGKKAAETPAPVAPTEPEAPTAA